MSGRPDDAPDDAPDDDTLAGEYVLGVLDQAERGQVRLRARTDAALAAAIAAWERRLAPFGAGIEPVPPPAALWDRLSQAVASAPPEDAPAPLRPAGRRWVWPLATAASLALAAGLAGLMVFRPAGPAAIGFAALAPIDAPAAAFVAEAQRDGSVTLAALLPQEIPPGRDFELWVLPPGAQKAASLGVLPREGRTLHLAALPATGTKLMVSIEPAGGSPTGQPTGQVLYAGVVMRGL